MKAQKKTRTYRCNRPDCRAQFSGTVDSRGMVECPWCSSEWNPELDDLVELDPITEPGRSPAEIPTPADAFVPDALRERPAPSADALQDDDLPSLLGSLNRLLGDVSGTGEALVRDDLPALAVFARSLEQLRGAVERQVATLREAVATAHRAGEGASQVSAARARDTETLRELREAMDRLQRALESTQKQSSERKEEIARLNAELQALQKRTDDTSSEARTLSKQLEKEKQYRRDANATAAQWQKEAGRLSEGLEKARQASETRATQLASEINDLKQTLQESDAEFQRVEEDLRKTRAERDRLVKVEAELQAVRSRGEIVERDAASLKKELEKAKAEAGREQKAAADLEDAVDDLRQRLEASEEERRRETKENLRQISDAERRFRDADAGRSEISRSFEALKATAAEMAPRAALAEGLSNEVKSLEKSLEGERDLRREAASQTARFASDLDSARQQAQRELSESQRELAEAKSHLAAALETEKGLRMRCEAAERRLKESSGTQGSLRDAQEQILSLRAELEEARTAAGSQRAALEEANRGAAETESAARSLQDQVREFQALRARCQALETEVLSARRESDDRVLRADGEKDKLTKLADETGRRVEVLSRELATAKEEAKQLRQQIEEADAEIEEMEEVRRRIEPEAAGAQALRSEMERVRKELQREKSRGEAAANQAAEVQARLTEESKKRELANAAANRWIAEAARLQAELEVLKAGRPARKILSAVPEPPGKPPAQDDSGVVAAVSPDELDTQGQCEPSRRLTGKTVVVSLASPTADGLTADGLTADDPTAHQARDTDPSEAQRPGEEVFVRFWCPGCGVKLKAPRRFSGRNTACSTCKAPLVVPAESTRQKGDKQGSK